MLNESRLLVLERFSDSDMQDVISEIRRLRALSAELASGLRECLRLTQENMPYEERKAKVALYEKYLEAL